MRHGPLNTPGSPPVTVLPARLGPASADSSPDPRARAAAAAAGSLVGIGDDAAVAEPERGALEVLTTDALVEGVHFDRRFSPPRDIGWKALAVNVCDIAAMGGTPRLALLSLVLPGDIAGDDVDELVDGFLALAARRAGHARRRQHHAVARAADGGRDGVGFASGRGKMLTRGGGARRATTST